MNIDDFIKPENKISIFNNPFNVEKITDISIRYSTNIFSGNGYWHGTIKFQNGKTTGSQNFGNYGPEEYSKLVFEMQAFINELNSTKP